MPYVNFDKPEDADRAILILALRRLVRPKMADGSFVKGFGGNRDDHPIFTDVCNRWARNQPIDKDVLFQARFRAKKYARQVQDTGYWQDRETHAKLLHIYAAIAPDQEQELDAQIIDHLKEAAGYGGW